MLFGARHDQPLSAALDWPPPWPFPQMGEGEEEWRRSAKPFPFRIASQGSKLMVQVVRSTVIDAPVDAVWRLLRDFNGHRDWHPAVAESEIENGRAADEVGAVRRFRLTDGSALREQLLKLSDADHSFTYCLLEAPIPLLGYVASVSLK